MCDFFSVTSDGRGEIKYFDWELRQKCLSGELNYNPDSHTSINDYFGFKGNLEDQRNKYEYNPLTERFKIDQINGENDSKEVEEKVRNLDFNTIVPQLIIKLIIHPFKIESNEVTQTDIDNLNEWVKVKASIRASVGAPVTDLIGNSIWISVWTSVGTSVWDSVWDSVGTSVWDSVGTSVWDSVGAYTSSFFNLEEWKYIEHEPNTNPFQCCINLWERGFVPSFDGKIWRLHSGKDAKVVYERKIS